MNLRMQQVVEMEEAKVHFDRHLAYFTDNTVQEVYDFWCSKGKPRSIKLDFVLIPYQTRIENCSIEEY